MRLPLPTIGSWYRQLDGSLCEVVAVDADDNTIEVQHFDGTLEEFEGDTWEELQLQETDAPEDWTGSVDVEPEDYDHEREAPPATLWADPLGYLDRTEAQGYSEWPAPLE